MIRGLEGSAAENISAVTGAIKALSEIAITRDVLATEGGSAMLVTRSGASPGPNRVNQWLPEGRPPGDAGSSPPA